MTYAPRNPDLSALWQPSGPVPAEPCEMSLPVAARTIRLNISHLPAPDQSRIWAFLEFMHEYSSTEWRLVQGNTADIWFVDQCEQHPLHPWACSGSTVRVRNILLADGSTGPLNLDRPLQMEAFAATLLAWEARLFAPELRA